MERNVSVKLSAEVTQYLQATGQAANATEELAASAERAQAAQRSMGEASAMTASQVSTVGQNLQQNVAVTDRMGEASQRANVELARTNTIMSDAGSQARAFDSSMSQAGTSLGSAMQLSGGLSGTVLGLGNGMLTAGQNARQMGQEVIQSARTQSQEWTQVGTSLAVVGGGITAMVGSVLGIGIAYNTLQQVAGRAMETMTGSTEAAADQMERLHSFADTSPFARDTWIQAQQQLMAFGLEAERVVPTLEGVQNAVAAIGGGDQEIMQLVDILGTVEGQGKMTGRELQRLGQMGINAAELIGESMGMTGNQIREQITAGALDADTAITALTDGMMTKFDGAAEGLRDTMTGALDRIRARVRDIGSVLAEPLVGAGGGGFLVDATNQAADFLAMIRDLPPEVVQIGGAITGLGGVALLAGAGFLVLAPRIVETVDALARMRQSMPSVDSNLGKVARTVGVLAAGFTALMVLDAVSEQFRTSGQSASEFELELNRLQSAGDNVNSVFESMEATTRGALFLTQTKEINDLGDAMSFLDQSSVGWLAKIPLLGNLDPVSRSYKTLEEDIAGLDGAFSSLVSGGNIEGAVDQMSQMAELAIAEGQSLEDLSARFPEYVAALRDYANENGIAASSTELLQWAFEGVAPAAVEAAGGLDEYIALQERLADTGASEGGIRSLGEALREQAEYGDAAADALSDVVDMYTRLGLLQRDAGDAVASLAEAFADLNEQITGEDVAATLDRTTQSGRDNRQAFIDVADAAWELAEANAATGSSAEEVAGGLDSTRDSLIATAREMGYSKEEAAAMVNEFMLIPEGVETDYFFNNFAEDAVAAAIGMYDELPDEVILYMEAQTEDAQAALEAVQTQDLEALVNITGNESEAREIMDSFTSGDYQAIARIFGDDAPAQGTVFDFTNGEYVATADIDGNPVAANQAMASFLNGDYKTTAEIMAQDPEARATMNRFLNGDYRTTANVSADDSSARGTINTLTGTDWFTEVYARAVTAAAEADINRASRDRTATIYTRVAQLSSGVIMNQNTHGPTMATGGRAPAASGWLPSYSNGGRLPYTGLGTDKILGVNAQGNPTSWVDDLEWIINRRSSDKYSPILSAINRDDPRVHHLAGFAAGGRPGYQGSVREFTGGGSGRGMGAGDIAAALSNLAGGPRVSFNVGSINNPRTEAPSMTAKKLTDYIPGGGFPE